MGYEGSYAAICAQVNSAFEVRGLIEYIGWHPEKLTQRGDVFSALCPIHQDPVFRTLVLNPRKNTYHCEHGNCPGNYPADFLDLLVKVFHKPLPEVIQDAVDHFGAEYFRLTPRQLKVIEELVLEARARPQKE
jgi:hypothetical protein